MSPGSCRNIDEFLGAWRNLEIDERIAYLAALGMVARKNDNTILQAFSFFKFIYRVIKNVSSSSSHKKTSGLNLELPT